MWEAIFVPVEHLGEVDHRLNVGMTKHLYTMDGRAGIHLVSEIDTVNLMIQ